MRDPASPEARPPQAGHDPSPGRRKGSVTRRAIERVRVADGRVERSEARDALASEEPLEIRVAGSDGATLTASVTMRTPGSDFELAAGFLFGEGVLDGRDALLAIRYCVEDERDGPQRYNRVTAHLAAAGAAPAALPGRGSYTTSSCGVCGKASLEEALAVPCPQVGEGTTVSAATLLALPGRLRATQKLFDSTGGLHAAALFDASGRLVRVREDVGRHNAMDKVVGASLLAGELPLRDRLLLVSGRVSFELVQKAARAGVPLLAGVSAPSSLAVDLAERVGITLVGFLRQESFNVYSAGHRVSG